MLWNRVWSSVGAMEAHPIRPPRRNAVDGWMVALIVFPAGEDGTHQVINTSDEPITYLCFASHQDSDIVIYSDSNKVLVESGTAPELDKLLPGDTELDYWDGE